MCVFCFLFKNIYFYSLQAKAEAEDEEQEKEVGARTADNRVVAALGLIGDIRITVKGSKKTI